MKKRYILIALEFSLIAVQEIIISELRFENLKEEMQPPLTKEDNSHDPPTGAEPKQAKPHLFG